jgi:hypothetical protein
MWEKYKLSSHTRITLAILLLLLVGIPLYAYYVHTGPAGSQTLKMIFSSFDKGEIYITDSAGKQVAKTTYPKYTRLNFQAASPDGNILVSTGANTAGETFMVLQNSTLKKLSAETVKKLHESTLVGLSHHLYFADESTVLMVVCPAPAECTLDSLNLGSGEQKTIIKTGLQQATALFPQAFLVGYSENQAYLRLNGTNKLGKSSAVYKIDTTQKKVVSSSIVPASVGYSLSLSPDHTKIAYPMVDAKNKTVVHILDLASGKEQKIDWNLGTMPNTEALKWSPDSKKILGQTQSFVLPPGSKEAAQPIKTGYIDLDKQAVVALQQIADSLYATLVYQDWLDNGTVVYQAQKSSKPGDFTKPTWQTATQDISSKKISDLRAPAGDLARVFYVNQ